MIIFKINDSKANIMLPRFTYDVPHHCSQLVYEFQPLSPFVFPQDELPLSLVPCYCFSLLDQGVVFILRILVIRDFLRPITIVLVNLNLIPINISLVTLSMTLEILVLRSCQGYLSKLPWLPWSDPLFAKPVWTSFARNSLWGLFFFIHP